MTQLTYNITATSNKSAVEHTNRGTADENEALTQGADNSPASSLFRRRSNPQRKKDLVTVYKKRNSFQYYNGRV